MAVCVFLGNVSESGRVSRHSIELLLLNACTFKRGMRFCVCFSVWDSSTGNNLSLFVKGFEPSATPVSGHFLTPDIR